MEIGDQLRAEMGGQRFTANAIEMFEPADPRAPCRSGWCSGRSSAVIVLVALMSWLNQRSLEPPEEASETAAPATAQAPVATPAAPQQAAPAVAGQPVVLTATRAGMAAGQRKGRSHPLLRHAAAGPDVRRARHRHRAGAEDRQARGAQVKVGNQAAPPVGPAATTGDINVSLLPADLMKRPAQQPTADTGHGDDYRGSVGFIAAQGAARHSRVDIRVGTFP